MNCEDVSLNFSDFETLLHSCFSAIHRKKLYEVSFGCFMTGASSTWQPAIVSIVFIHLPLAQLVLSDTKDWANGTARGFEVWKDMDSDNLRSFLTSA
jgi:hypothetical protein